MKIKLNWKMFLIFFIVCGGLLYLTRSFLMTLGILLVLFVIDGVLKNIDNKHRRKKISEKVMNDLKSDKD